jgi:transposase
VETAAAPSRTLAARPEGERDPRKLASLAHYRVQKSQAQIDAALTGDYRPELLFVVSQALDNYRQMGSRQQVCGNLL